MKRIFSPKSSDQSRSRSNSSSKLPSSNLNGITTPPDGTSVAGSADEISPELTPIVTLLSAQAHRRYNEGVFMVLQSINSDGEPVSNRQWREVYGVLLGTQLAIWDIEELERHQNNTDALLNASAKPDYINFTDSSFRAVERLDNSNGLKNVIVVSTTLKNQFLLQYPELEDFHRWNAAFRLATFEYTSLQEAYTGALLSARGSKLSDIRTILAETKFDHEDWVSVRFGSGMPWKRCYAVIEQPQKKSKKGKVHKGTVSFYKDEKKQKKSAMAIIKDASATYALYPNSVKMIDHSTMIKLEGTVFFDSSKKSLPKEASVYFMPEQHSAVPGYDTLIRFLIPLLNTFALYGRPKRLNANKTDLNSLLFGLPVLPHVHYLEVDDLILLASNANSSNWLVTDWREKTKEILGRKLSSGYTGCGSSHGVMGAMGSPALSSNEFLAPSNAASNRPISPLSPSFLPAPRFRDSTISKSSSLNIDSSGETSEPPSPPRHDNRRSEISQIYEDYSNVARMDKPQQQPQQAQRSLESLPRATGAGIGFSQGNLADPYIPNKTQPQASSGSTLQDPYSAYKRSDTHDDSDEDFDNDEIFQKGVSSMSVKDLPNGSNEDVFNPDYANQRVVNSPQLQLQSKSKPLPTPAIKVEHVSPYTSGRISSPTEAQRPQLPTKASYDSYSGRITQQAPDQSQPSRVDQSKPIQFSKPIPRSEFQRFTPTSSQEHLPQPQVAPQHQASPRRRPPPQQSYPSQPAQNPQQQAYSDPYQDARQQPAYPGQAQKYPSQQPVQQPSQQLSQSRPIQHQQQARPVQQQQPPQQRVYQHPPPQQRQFPQQQQQQQQPPPHGYPVQQLEQQRYQQPQGSYPPSQQQQQTRRAPPPQNTYPPVQPQQQQQPRPANPYQQQQQGYPPQHQQARPVQQQGYPTQQRNPVSTQAGYAQNPYQTANPYAR